ncbi:MAG: endopeptidase La, partial [Proteobacteria bacterium]|nr:endopeptidase La [Pseudomonadota bacterium]
ATAIASALTRVPVRANVAMTGEITLRGRVLPIGGLKEKLIAAHRGGVSKVLIPKENEKDLKDIPAKIQKSLEIIRVEHMDEVLSHALAVPDPSAFLQDGYHEIDDIYEVPGARPTAEVPEVPHPAGIN